MMTKKHLLLSCFYVALGAFMCAFRYSNAKPSDIFTLFYPDHTPGIAVEYAPAQADDASTEQSARFRGRLDTLDPRYDDFLNTSSGNPYDLQDPKAIDSKVEYDPETGLYLITEKIGDEYYRAPTYMTFAEYTKWKDKKQQNDYFDRLQGVSNGKKGTGSLVDPIAKFNIKNSLIERLFGGTEVEGKPQGNINLTFGVNHQKVENPVLTLRQQRQNNFDFDMDINMSAQYKVGEKLNLNFNYNTQATFDFDNQMKIHYDPKNFSEDEILQNIEAGNVSMPLRSQLIKGAQNLFGVKTELKFGHLRTTIVASQQRSKQQSLQLQGGAQIQQFNVPIDEYDENRHFFISHWNRAQFEPSLKCLPVPLSQFTITRLEVWITNDRALPPGTNNTSVRPIVALMDLAEPNPFLDGKNEVDTSFAANIPNFKIANPVEVDNVGVPLPTNGNNDLYRKILQKRDDVRTDARAVRGLKELGLTQIRDFEKTNAIQLTASEYNYNEQLGFISINRTVQPDQVIALAVEYTYNGIPHKIGEFGSDVEIGDTLNQNVLFLKMLKTTTNNVRYPLWDLMMKNVYSVGAANVDPQEFRFDVFYEDPGKGQKRFLNQDFIPASLRAKPLLQIFNLDNLNLQGDPGADGIFDFVPGLTINLRSGRIMFPVLEPFGNFLYKQLEKENGSPYSEADSTSLAKKLLYTQLYDSTLFRAREFQQLNRFTLRGTYKSSNSAEISLGTFNLPRGSVRVSGGGRQLQEGIDYEIDYNIGKLRILDDAILQSGQTVNVSFEDNTLFGFNARTMIGARFDYEFSKKLTVGGTFMNLFERPLTQKVNFGDDPINNKVYGLDVNYSDKAPWLTKFVDKIPFIDTKAESSVLFAAEVAALQPGYNKAISQGEDRGGTVYIDDFEGSTANLPLSFPANSWIIASVPQGSKDANLFPENKFTYEGPDSLALGANRSKLSWYVADPSARDGGDNDSPYSRLFRFNDIFPNRQLSPLEQSILRPLDVTIYPQVRGPYNFEVPDGYPGISKGLTVDGSLVEPKTRWAGFMRGFNNSNNDFEASNVEFIEFWMLNPYIDKPEGVSEEGEMFIELGNISEDVLRDSRQFFENALPTEAGSTQGTVPTPWGRIPVLPPLIQAFDNTQSRRTLQDVGLDGLNDTDEATFFVKWLNTLQAQGLPAATIEDLRKDPAADNFYHFRDARFSSTGDVPTPGILRRYRDFNSTQGNTPEGSGQDFVTSSTNFPDSEDLNRDNTLNETESYFRYRIKLAKNTDLSQPGALDLQDPALAQLITDTVEVIVNGVPAIWYRFKLPLDWVGRESVNGIQDFRSIRFVRMLWKGFTEQTTFRFATLELGRNQWRRFNQAITTNQYNSKCTDRTSQSKGVSFDVNSVNIEENAARIPFNYTIPKGIARQQSVGAFPDLLQNEQALSLTICDLPNCDGRAIFKPLNMDLRQFENIKMFVHGEKIEENDINKLQDGDLSVFMRLGSDFVSNYYEYEIPLVLSNKDKLPADDNSDSDEYKLEVWKAENNFDVPLEFFETIKRERNKKDITVGETYVKDTVINGVNVRIKIVGNPNLGLVKGAMVGVVNRDSFPHCVEVWFNELRLVGFNNRGGYAGTARIDMKLADLGNFSATGLFTSRGWGGIDQKLLQRQLEDVYSYDVSTNLALDRFFPTKWGLKLPFYAQYSNLTRRPEYDPYDLDVKLSRKIADAETAQEKRDIRAAALDRTITRGYNFTNVRKERKGGARKIPLPWNIENFTFNYARNQKTRSTPFLIKDELNQYKGGFDYTYSTGMKPIYPFKKLITKDKYLKFLTEFNFSPLPSTYGFSTNLERISQTTVWRFAGEDPALNTYNNRRFTWDRNYDLGWDIAKSLKFNFDANARSLIDEPLSLNADGRAVTKTERRDSILTNMRNLGRPKSYTHNASLNYTLPFKTIPFMEWINVKASYTTNYTWTAQSLKLTNMEAGQFSESLNSRSLGNVIQNSSVRQVNGDFDFTNLYNKSKYLAKINKPAKPGGSKGKKAGDGGRGGDSPGATPGSPGGIPGGIPGGGPGGKGKDGKDAGGKNDSRIPGGAIPGGVVPGGGKGQPRLGPDGKPIPGSDADAKDDGKNPKSKGKSDKDKKKEREPSLAERIALRPLMLVRKGRFTYSENLGTVVPGFTPNTKLMGLSEGFGSPGWAFVAGFQPDTKWIDNAGANGWITHRPELNQQITRNKTQNLDAGLTIEPFLDFRIELTATRQYTQNSTELFKDQAFNLDPTETDFQHRATRDMGSLTVSYMAINTLFRDKESEIKNLFTNYLNNGPVISRRLAEKAGNTELHVDQDKNPGYYKGYGRISQEVLLPSFLAAYTGQDPNTASLDVFNTRPAVNWKLQYNGLSKVGKLNKIFASVQLSHGYRSTLTMSQYNTDIFYDAAQPYTVDTLNNNYIARLEIPQVIISEQFLPLLGLDIKLKNDMSFKFDFKKARTLSMSFVDYNLSETRTTGYVGGFGYRIKNVDIPFLTGSKKKGGSKSKSKSKKSKDKPGAKTTPPPAGGGSQARDLNIKFDFEYRDDITLVHSIQRADPQPSRGSRTISINPSVDYQLNRRLSLRMFCDYRKTVPKTSQSFPITTLNAGVTVQFKLN